VRTTIVLVALAACGGGSSPDNGACDAPLDGETLQSLTHSAFALPAVEIQPGMERDLGLGTVGLGGAFEAVEACATWSISPSEGATVDPVTGVVRVDAATASNSRFVVTADVESGRKLITADVIVFRQEEMPWRGNWREDKQLVCGTGEEVDPEEVLNEVIFWADGTLWVTWNPFELYIDYEGTHDFDAGAGTVEVVSLGGNFVPADIDGSGTFTLDGDTLTLQDLWLGSPQGSTQPARCGHKLVR
jgi:hypothetical protein